MIKEKHISQNKEDSSVRKFSELINVFDDEFFWFKDEPGGIYYSDNFNSLTGFQPTELTSFEEIIFKEDLLYYKKTFIEAAENYQSDFDLEYRITTKNEQIKWLKEDVKIFRDEDGVISRTIGRVSDITCFKDKAIQMGNINIELKKENADKDSFLSILSHDLKSPFTSILGFTEILLKDSSYTESDKNEYLTYIHSSSEKLLKLINYLLDWSKLKSGRIKIELLKLNIKSLIYNSISSLTGTAVRKNIDIKVNAENNLFIKGDERLIGIVITNLFSNAVKFSPENSKVIINANQFNDDFIELVVTDSGKGISEVNKSRMFKIEKIYPAAGTSGEKGTGFGLILTKEIVEKHGGKLWFFTEENSGSEFHVTFPLFKPIVLIVENEVINRDHFIRVIQDNFKDFKIISAGSAFEAIEISGKTIPSVIILNHNMKLINGLQLIQSILSIEPRQEFKTIVFTDYASDDLQNSYKKYGEVFFLKYETSEIEFQNVLTQIL